MGSGRRVRVATASGKVITLEEAEEEKRKATPEGEALRSAERTYRKPKR